MGHFKTPVSPMGMISRQKLMREIMKKIYAMNQMDLSDNYKTFHSNMKEYTFFSAPGITFSKVAHIVNHNASLNRKLKYHLVWYLINMD